VKRDVRKRAGAVDDTGVVAAVDRVLRRVDDGLRLFHLDHEVGDVREDVEGGVEQRGAPDPLGMARGELEDEPAAERVPDPVGLLQPERVDGLDEVGDVCLERPRRVPTGAAVPA
jgi:hypothetical protein